MKDRSALDNTNTYSFKNSTTLSVSKAAKLLNLSPSTLRRLEQQNRITADRLTNGYRVFKLGDLLKLKQELDNKETELDKIIQWSNLTKPRQNNKIPRNKAKGKIADNKTTIRKLHTLSKFKNTGYLAIATLLLAISPTLVTKLDILRPNSGNAGAILSKISSIALSTRDTTQGSNLGAVLGQRDNNPEFVFNVNVPTNIKSTLDITETLGVAGVSTLMGGVTTNTLTFVTPGSINNLLTIDDITETTFESLLDIDGDVVGTGLNDVKVVGINGSALGNVETTGDNILMAQGSKWESVEQTEITQLGTIGTGVWQGTEIETGYGGTGLATYATGDMLYAESSNVLANLSIGTAGMVLYSTGNAPQWETASSALGDTVFLHEGNSFGETSVLGTNDTYDLTFETDGT